MKRAAITAMALAAVLAAGCARIQNKSDAFDPDESCLYVAAEGTVTAVTVEHYDSGDYSEEELKASTEEYLAAFNGADEGSGGDMAAELEECTLGDGIARLRIRFSDAAQYLRFMKEYPDEESAIQVKKLDVVPVPEGVKKGYIVGASFTEAGSGNKSIAAGDIMEKTKMSVIAVEGPAVVYTGGTIRYVSSGAAVSGNRAETDGSETAYIVFE